MAWTGRSPSAMAKPKRESLCVRCRGFMALCGKRVCPILVKAKTYLDLQHLKDDIAGSAPPAVFVGSYGYPKVIAGPLIPPVSGDTMHMDSEKWLGLGFDEILRNRFQLVSSKSVININSAADPAGVLEKIQEMVLSDKPVDTEASFLKKPDSRVAFSMREAPTGPSADLKSFSIIDNPSVPHAVDKVTSRIRTTGRRRASSTCLTATSTSGRSPGYSRWGCWAKRPTASLCPRAGASRP